MTRIVVLCLSFIFLYNQLKAQDSIENSITYIQEILSEITELEDEEINQEEISEFLYQLLTNPIKINTSDEQELKRIFWLNDSQVSNLINYIKKNGQILSIFELSYIEGFSENDSKLLAPFLSFETSEQKEKVNCKELIKYSKQKILLRTQKILEKQAGYKNEENKTPSFSGDPLRYYLRYHWYNEHISVGITGEKDPGEDFFSGKNQNGFDFYSWHFQLKNLNTLKNLIIGDYKLSFGQGLVAGSSFSVGKLPALINSAYQNSGINRYTGTSENLFFRGMASTLGYKNYELSLFYSNKNLDANLSFQDSISGKSPEVLSFQTSGNHCTSWEKDSKDAVNCKNYGSNIKYKSTNAELGITALFTNYNIPVNPTPQPYNYGYFRGTFNYTSGINYRLRTGKILWFGECAMSKNKQGAILNGLQTYIFSGATLTVIFRNYDKAFQSIYGKAFGENVRNQNESGLYIGWQCTPLKYTTLAGYADYYKFKGLRYQTDMPSTGNEYLFQTNITPNTWFQINIQCRFKQKEENEKDIKEYKNVISSIKTEQYRFGITYSVNQSLQLKNRVEYLVYRKDPGSYSEGYCLSQDINYRVPGLPLQIYFRYAIFDTDSYDSRIYTYEKDLLYSSNIPVLYDKGSRISLLVKLQPSETIDFWIKYSATHFANKEKISSGLYEIEGNRKSEIKLQIMIKF